MKLKRFLLRYYPPGIILEYELRDGTREMKEIDLLHLTAEYAAPVGEWKEVAGRTILTMEVHAQVGH